MPAGNRGARVVVLVSRGSEEPRTPAERRATVLDAQRRNLHRTTRREDSGARGEPTAERARSVVACVAAYTPLGQSASVSASLAAGLSKLVRHDDRICTVGGGRVVVMFEAVDAGLSAHVLGARLASSGAQRLSEIAGHDSHITVGVADGEPGTDSVRLTCEAINCAESAEAPAPDRFADPGRRWAVVVSMLPSSDGHLSIPHRVLTSPAHVPGQTMVFVVDSDPPSAGVPSPACTAVTSLVEKNGLSVSGTLAPSSRMVAEVNLPTWQVPDDSVALLVVHPGRGPASEFGGDGAPTDAALERPAILTQVLRQSGMRVLAVSVGASHIALAECVVQGAEDAFTLGDLPEGIARAMAPHDDQSHETDTSDTASASNGHSNPNGNGRGNRLSSLLLLTRSERRVLHHLTTGSTATEIADDLVLSIATVRSHIRSILRKLDVSSQLAAVAIARGYPARSSEGDRPERERPSSVNRQAAADAPEH